MQFFLLLPILFIINSSLPIQEEVQHLWFPPLILALGLWLFFRKRKEFTLLPLNLTLLGSGFLFWALWRLPSQWYNSSTQLLWLGCIGILISMPSIRIRHGWWLFVIVCVLVQSIAWLEVMGIRIYGDKPISVVTSVFNQKNHFQLFCIPLAWASCLWLWSQSWRILSTILGVSAILLCILSKSDAGIVACAGAFLAIAWWHFQSAGRWAWLPWAGIIGFMLVPFWAKLMLPWVAGHASILSRIAIWDSAIGAIQASPWLGHGFGTFQSVIRDYTTQIPELDVYLQNGLVGAAHNHFLHTWVELGLVGFLMELTFFSAVTWSFYRWARSKKGVAMLWMGVPVFVLLMISITIPSQVFFSARLGVWTLFIGLGGAADEQVESQKTFRIRVAILLLGALLVLSSWLSEYRRLESMQILAPEIVGHRVERDRFYVIPKALEIDSRNPHALWFMAQGYYHNQMGSECLQVLERLEANSGQYFPVRNLRQKCQDLMQ